MKKKILIAVGGTGGHIFPAISLGKQLTNLSHQIHYVGGNLESNPYFDHKTLTYHSIVAATFRKKNPWALIKTSTKIALGINQSLKILKDLQPDLVVGFGSYYTFPVLVAALIKGYPFVLHEANSIPGKVNGLLSKYARAVGVQFPEAAALLKGDIHEVGLPLRPGYTKDACSVPTARAYFDLSPNRLTLLVFGGSQGALKLNQIVVKTLTNQLSDKMHNFQVLHFVGDSSLSEILKKEYQQASIQACVKPFESRMDLAWQAADISIARSGAGTIAEQLEFEVPGILIPYPFATDNHQDKNADFLATKVRGALKCKEDNLTPITLAQQLEAIFSNEKRKELKQAMQEYKSTYRVKNFCDLVVENLYP